MAVEEGAGDERDEFMSTVEIEEINAVADARRQGSVRRDFTCESNVNVEL